jgi:hypothetical protein
MHITSVYTISMNKFLRCGCLCRVCPCAKPAGALPYKKILREDPDNNCGFPEDEEYV